MPLTTYPNPVNHGQIAPQAGHPRRKGLTRPGPETGRESPDLLVSIAVAALPAVCGLGALALGALLPSWLVLGVIVVLILFALVRGGR